MKTLKTIQTLAKIGKILSCIAFIFACIGFGGSVVGALSAAFGGGFAIKLGGVTIYDLFGGARYSELEGVCAALLGWMIVCAGRRSSPNSRSSTLSASLRRARPLHSPARRS